VKKASVIWSTEALVDLEIVYDFLADQSVSAAQRIVEQILSRIKQIEDFPESGGRQEALKKTGTDYRYLVEGNYKIIYSYRVDLHVAYVETIFDTRSDPEKSKV
jgi:plasmid stabilization system protein ParE